MELCQYFNYNTGHRKVAVCIRQIITIFKNNLCIVLIELMELSTTE